MVPPPATLLPVSRPRFRTLPHTADLRLVVWGADLPALLGASVAGALACALGRAPAGAALAWSEVEHWPVAPTEQIVRLVNEALFLLYTRHQVAVTVRPDLRRVLLGTRPLGRRRPLLELKAATFHDLAVKPCARGLRAVIVLDT
jgi:SHS2 domain-containing protein